MSAGFKCKRDIFTMSSLTTTTRILQFFVFISVLSTGITKFEFEMENEMNSDS